MSELLSRRNTFLTALGAGAAVGTNASAQTGRAPAGVYDVKQFGASARKADKATKAFQAAVDAAFAAGGGVVYVPAGEYTSGPIEIKSNVNVHLDAGATIFVSREADDYPRGRGDARRPAYGAWWRHGSAEKTYIEEPLPKSSGDYALRMDPWKRGEGDFVLEARVEMASTLGKSDPDWRPPKPGDEYGLEIVHTDPDGGGYGAHLLVYGRGDDDATWGRIKLVGPIQPVERKKN